MTNLEQSANLSLHDFQRVVFFTGAGLSVASGIPTYRGAGGMWKDYRWEEVACEEAFASVPEKVWDFHDWRREKVAACEPNAAHHAIADFVAGNKNSVVVTQNIDGLHQRSGVKDVLELHGSLWRVRVDGKLRVAPYENFEVPIGSRRHVSGPYLRPDIVWFGDSLRSDVIDAAVTAIRQCDCLVSVGTSAQVFPAAQLPLDAKHNGATMIEINPEPTQMSDAYDFCLRGPAIEVLPALTAFRGP